jgi:hypothetical protein
MDRQTIENSSNILSAGYDPATQTMHVEFKSGAVYEYPGVDNAKWTTFQSTFDDQEQSTGGHFGRTFRHWPNAKKV